MKIGIDARIYPTGIWRYSTNLIKELAMIAKPDDEFVVFVRRSGYDALELPDDRFRKVLADFAPYSFKEQLLFPFILWKEHCDLIHFTNFNAPVLWPKKFVITIHDLIHQSHSTFGSTTRNKFYYRIKKIVYEFVIRFLSWRAAQIIVPSESTKNDLHENLKTPLDKMPVTYEGIDRDLLTVDTEPREGDEALLSTYQITKPFLLYVATMYPHKNHRFLIKAFKKIHEQKPDLQLVLVGKVDYFSQQIKDELKQQEIDSVLLPNFQCNDGYLPDEALKVLYRNASLYVFPSLKEGFGIPLLEAQAYGVPVLSSDIPCLVEVGGESVGYFDPHDEASLVQAMTAVLTDPRLQGSLRSKGFENIQRFSWAEMAQQTYRIYQEVLT